MNATERENAELHAVIQNVADELMRLREENARLRVALQAQEDGLYLAMSHRNWNEVAEARKIGRAALEAKP